MGFILYSGTTVHGDGLSKMGIPNILSKNNICMYNLNTIIVLAHGCGICFIRIWWTVQFSEGLKNEMFLRKPDGRQTHRTKKKKYVIYAYLPT